MNVERNMQANVLIVDDMATNRKLMTAILGPLGYQFTEASSGEEALKYIAENEFDAMLLDIMMPGIDGLEVCRRVRKDLNQKLLPIILVTTLMSPDDIAKGMEAGANDYVSKPFNGVEMVARIKAAVDHKRMTDRLDDTESALFALARMVEAKDKTTGDHCDRLAHTAVVFGEYLGLGYDEIEALRKGGVLHDIGKLGIPDSILLKEDPLTDEEWVIMRQHTVIGARLCQPLKSMRKTADIVLCHHEKWDGTGYPQGLKGEDIPLLARIFQILDIYDALSSVRPYKKAFPHDKVIAIMKEETEKGMWDPELMDKFMHIITTRPDDLKLDENLEKDRSAVILDSIVKTGAIDWDRRNKDT